MLDIAEILVRLDDERRHLARDDEAIEILPSVTRLRTQDRSYHSVNWSSLSPDDADAVIHHEIEHHRHLGTRFEWKYYRHDKPEDLLDRLQRLGFQIGPLEAVLVFDLTTAGGWIESTDISSVRDIDRLDQIQEFQQVYDDVFRGGDDFVVRQLAWAIQSGTTQHQGYIAFVDDEPAGIGRLYTSPASCFGGLYGGGTRPKFRGRGIYRAVVAARARVARARGARYLVVNALPPSRVILERLGFELLTDRRTCRWEA